MRLLIKSFGRGSDLSLCKARLISHLTASLIHDDFNTVKVCHSANPTKVGFVHIYESCILVTLNAFLRHVPLGFSTWDKF